MDDTQAAILIVDDERFFREAISDILGAQGFACASCEDGEGALKLLAAEAFGVAVVDIRLPGVDGIEVLRQLRTAQPDLRVIMLSSASDQEPVLEALRSGACDYLVKPLHDEELVLAVRQAARDHRVARDLVSLRSRIDEGVDGLEAFALEVDAAIAAERPRILREAAVRTVARILEVQKASLLLLDEVSGQLDVVAAHGREVEARELDRVIPGKGIAGRVFEDRTALVVSGAEVAGDLSADLHPERYESASFVVATVAIGDRAYGVVTATDRREGVPLQQQDLALLRLIAVQLAERLEAERTQRDPFELGADLESDLAEDLGGDLGEALGEELEGELSGSIGQEVRAPVSATASDAPTRDNALGPDPGISTGEMMPLDLAREVADAARIVGDASDIDAEIARQVCDAIVNELDPDAMLRKALRPIEAALSADPVALYLIENETGQLVLESCGERGLRSDHERLPTGRGLTGSVLQRGQLVASADPQADPRFDPEVDSPKDQKAGPLLCVPIQLRGKTVGLCRIHLAPGASVSPRTGEVLVAALSAAVRNVLLYRSLLESIEEVAEARREARG